MVIAMHLFIARFCTVWSLVLIGLAGRNEAYESALGSVMKLKRMPSNHRDLLSASDSGQRGILATKTAKNGRVELSDIQTRFPVPRVIERLPPTAGGLAPVVLPLAAFKMTSTPAPAPKPEAAALADVSVNCFGPEFTVRVKKNFYDFFATPSELTLGRTCKSNGVDESSGDLLFTYPMTSCDSRQEKMPGYVVYKYTLHFVPLPTTLPVRWAHGLTVDIECRMKSIQHVFQRAVRPTWATPARKTLQGQIPGYGIRTMNEGWNAPSPTNIFLLGQTVQFQVFALSLPAGGQLYIDRCHASTSPDPEADPKHPVIDNYGCMVHSKQEGGDSGFLRRTNRSIDFVLEAFQFNKNPAAEVFLHCELSVAVGGPTATAKSCSYGADGRWSEISGSHVECRCCESQCRPSKTGRPMYEGHKSSGPLIFSSVGPEPGSRTLPVLPGLGEIVSPKSHQEEEEERGAEFQDYEDAEWSGEYDYAFEYEGDPSRGEGRSTYSTGKTLWSGEGWGDVGSAFLKKVAEMGEETGEKDEGSVVGEGEGPVFGDEEDMLTFKAGMEKSGQEWLEFEEGPVTGEDEEEEPVFGQKIGEGAEFRDEEISDVVVPTFKAGMEKTGEEWPVFGQEELSEGVVPTFKAGKERSGEESTEFVEGPVTGEVEEPVFGEKIGEGPVFGVEELNQEVVPTFKAGMEKSGEEWPEFEGEDLSEEVMPTFKAGMEKSGEEWPEFEGEDLSEEVVPTFKAGMEKSADEWPEFGGEDLSEEVVPTFKAGVEKSGDEWPEFGGEDLSEEVVPTFKAGVEKSGDEWPEFGGEDLSEEVVPTFKAGMEKSGEEWPEFEGEDLSEEVVPTFKAGVEKSGDEWPEFGGEDLSEEVVPTFKAGMEKSGEEWPEFEGEDLSEEVVPTFKAGMEKSGEEWPEFEGEDLNEEVVPTFKAGMEKSGEEWPEFEGEDLSEEVVPTFKAGVEKSGDEWPEFGEGEEIKEGPVFPQAEVGGNVAQTFKAGMGGNSGKEEWPLFGEGEWTFIEEQNLKERPMLWEEGFHGDETVIGRKVDSRVRDGLKFLVKKGSKFNEGEDGGVAVRKGLEEATMGHYGISSGVGVAKFLSGNS